MITLISFILVLVGAFNWFSIGVLQFDFVAGLFGSQANIFSRLVYAIIGFAAIWLIIATIKQKGKIFVSSKNSTDTKIIDKVKNFANKGKKNKGNFKEQENQTVNDNYSHISENREENTFENPNNEFNTTNEQENNDN